MRGRNPETLGVGSGLPYADRARADAGWRLLLGRADGVGHNFISVIGR